MLHLLTLLLPLSPCFALRVMASSGIYKLDNGKPFLNNCFPAKNLLRKPEEGQVTSHIATFASQPAPALECLSRPFLFLQPLGFCSQPTYSHPFQATLPSSLREPSKVHVLPLCSLLFSDFPLLAPSPAVLLSESNLPLSFVQLHSFIYAPFHNALISRSSFYLPRMFQPSCQLSKFFPSTKPSSSPTYSSHMWLPQCPPSLVSHLPLSVSCLMMNYILPSS